MVVESSESMAVAEQLRAKIRTVPDFPKAGILFYDITTLLRDGAGFKLAIDALVAPYRGEAVELVVGVESRGFILAAAVADRLGAGFVPVRKPGKLPYRSLRAEYALEYGTDALEIHQDALAPGQSVLVVDDVIATGGTAAATGDLVARLGARVVAFVFLVELGFLNGRTKLPGHDVLSLIRY